MNQMAKLLLIISIFVCLFINVTFSLGYTKRAPPAVISLNVSQYVGRWYQVYGSATVQWTMEVGGHCVTADYAISAARDDVVTVQNGGHEVKVTGYYC